MSKMKQLLLDTIESSLPEEEQAYVFTTPDCVVCGCVDDGNCLCSDSDKTKVTEQAAE